MTTNSSSNIMSIPSEKQKMIKPVIGPVSDSFPTGSRVNLEQEHIVSIEAMHKRGNSCVGPTLEITTPRTILLNATFLTEDKVQSFKLNVILLGRSTTISLSMPLNWVLNLEDR
jgi:hypothetical protein